MSDLVRVPETSVTKMSDSAMEVIAHLCEGDCLTFGTVVSWCEARGDCVHTVTCPSCGTRFDLDEDDLSALERWTDAHGDALVCGVKDINAVA
jgi:hypothetical protein